MISNNKTQSLTGAEENAMLTFGVQTLKNESRLEAHDSDY